jgi:hypothetical protein
LLSTVLLSPSFSAVTFSPPLLSTFIGVVSGIVESFLEACGVVPFLISGFDYVSFPFTSLDSVAVLFSFLVSFPFYCLDYDVVSFPLSCLDSAVTPFSDLDTSV